MSVSTVSQMWSTVLPHTQRTLNSGVTGIIDGALTTVAGILVAGISPKVIVFCDEICYLIPPAETRDADAFGTAPIMDKGIEMKGFRPFSLDITARRLFQVPLRATSENPSRLSSNMGMMTSSGIV